MLTVHQFNNIQLADLPKIAAQIIGLKPNKVLLFYGEMGAGKTTLIKQLCKTLGVQDEVSSPTYSIINEYATVNNQTVYHFDFYRLKQEEEAYDFGIEEYLDSGAWCFMEWPEKIRNLLPEQYSKVELSISENGQRSILLTTIKHE